MAAHAGLLLCEVCGLLNRRRSGRSSGLACARCGTTLHARKPNSIGRTWALLIIAYLAYVPANVLPVLETESILEHTSDTILGGAVRLWAQGAWPLAVVIIVASFAVPIAKLFALTWLLVTLKHRTAVDAARRTQLYRVIDFIGRWSMVDIYVGGLLLALVQFHPLATVTLGPAAVAFCIVVVLTMLASRTFDPRLMWDADVPVEARPEPHRG